MKNRYSITPFIVYLFSFSACICTGDEGREDPQPTLDFEYLVFGHFYGECVGESCVEIFLLNSDELTEDINDQYPDANSRYNGDFAISHADKFSLVKDLPDFIPSRLLEEIQNRIGQPDAGDWGGLYIEYRKDGITKYWLIDQMKSNVPDYLHEFIDKVNEKISYINN